ncbi:MAG TPA: hypothetical protein DD638_05290 [Pasteurellaceae bacterium]|nr:hypothetical protein [Pasteurellaceae bacterium]
MKSFFYTLMAIFFLGLVPPDSYAFESKPYSYEIGGSIQIGEPLPKNISTLSKIKYISDGEKAVLVNNSNKELLIIDFCCGGTGEIQRILVKHNTALNKYTNPTNFKTFSTGNEIKLGVENKKILSQLGEPNEVEYSDGRTIFHYIIDDSHHPFLKKYNMPAYFEKYTFKDNVLESFEFGFAYP